MRMSALVASIPALLASACTPHMAMTNEPTTHGPASCRSSNSSEDCYIEVDAWMNKDGTCDVQVLKSQDMVGFSKTARGKWVEWRFTTSAEADGFRFPSNGIEPKPEPADNIDNWRSNFGTQGGPDHGGKQFKRRNNNDPAESRQIDYRYMVTVELHRPHLAPLPCKPQDPFIRNQR